MLRFRSRTAPFPLLTVLFLMVFCAWMAGAEEGASTTVVVQKVKAEKAGNAESPSIEASLKAYEGILKNLGYGTYKDAGKEERALARGGTFTLTAGTYAITVTLAKVEGGEATLTYVIKEGSKEVGTSSVNVRSGQVAPVQMGGKKSAYFLLFQLK